MPPVTSQAKTNRASRKREIPRNYILNWQASRAGAEKPLVRRPLTACEGCRSAKVRCSGLQDCDRCDRCAGRGLECKYAAASSTPDNSDQCEPAATKPYSTDEWPSLVPTTTSDSEMAMDLNFDAADPFSAAVHIADEHNNGTLPPPQDPSWSGERGSQGLGHIDWASIDMISSQHHLDFSPSGSSANNADLFSFLTSTSPPSDPSLSSPLVRHDSLMGSSASSYPSSFGPATHHPLSPNRCTCRADLMPLIPRISTAMQSKRPDEVFKVTGDIIRSCQNVVDCTSCEANCTDLICIVAILQQTEDCFAYLAEADLSSSIKVCVGTYQVSGVDDSRLRNVLVMDLVNQAGALIDCVNSMADEMLRQLKAGCRLGRINIEYLKTVAMDYRVNVLESVKKSFDES
ncbi:hypothetical protein VP1G_05884 [Cytospora mali]|uniref:Zn(2)-C6 fungal-type domain-containing protein n=1 Tax=Cytospora mali TaxID=578113 RepID=A0A194V411_CYTMA|nr:hypothetical protein VP1G_05884 [Valsa mali var. pyri (nom. inval.)]